MAQVEITPNLQRFFPALEREVQAHAETVAELICLLDRQYAGLADYRFKTRGLAALAVQ
jgi:hypothetical protein